MVNEQLACLDLASIFMTGKLKKNPNSSLAIIVVIYLWPLIGDFMINETAYQDHLSGFYPSQ